MNMLSYMYLATAVQCKDKDDFFSRLAAFMLSVATSAETLHHPCYNAW